MNSDSLSSPLCDTCAPDEACILSANCEPCGECWDKLPRSIQNIWERREREEARHYREWLHEL